MADYASSVRKGVMAAGRLHRRLRFRDQIERRGGSIDIFAAIEAVEIPLLLRPLDGLLGAYLSDPRPGILVTTQRPMSIQRFTASHELGHSMLDHQPSLDDESILRRMPLDQMPQDDFQEIEADAFATAFMMPTWLVAWHAERQGWHSEDFRRPNIVYQLALRMGASYEATCWTLVRHNLINRKVAQELVRTQPKVMKSALLADYRPQDYRGDVWLLTERDADTRIDGSRNDLFVLRLEEHSGGGYLWDIDQLRASGFAVVGDDLEEDDAETVGGPVIRRVTAAAGDADRGLMSLDERRPWDPDPPLANLSVEYDFTGPEEVGYSRAARRMLLEAA
jgi:Zn-dependent peptidase ImmA (M78 family)